MDPYLSLGWISFTSYIWKPCVCVYSSRSCVPILQLIVQYIYWLITITFPSWFLCSLVSKPGHLVKPYDPPLFQVRGQGYMLNVKLYWRVLSSVSRYTENNRWTLISFRCVVDLTAGPVSTRLSPSTGSIRLVFRYLLMLQQQSKCWICSRQFCCSDHSPDLSPIRNVLDNATKLMFSFCYFSVLVHLGLVDMLSNQKDESEELAEQIWSRWNL